MGQDVGGMEYPDFSSDCQVRRLGERGSCCVDRQTYARGDQELEVRREEASGEEGCGRGRDHAEGG